MRNMFSEPYKQFLHDSQTIEIASVSAGLLLFRDLDL